MQKRVLPKRTLTVILSTSLMAVLFALAFGGGCCKKTSCPKPPPPTPVVKDPEPGPKGVEMPRVTVVRTGPGVDAKEVAYYARAAQAMLKVQELLSWHTRTRGEKSVIAATYVGREKLVARKVLARLEAYLRSLTGESDKEERRATEYLRDYLAAEYIGRKTAHFGDRLANLEASSKVRLSWMKDLVSFSDLPVLLSKEKNAARREEIKKTSAEVIRTKLNPVLEQKFQKAYQEAQFMGFDSYFQLSERLRRADIKSLVTKGAAFVEKTETLHKELLERVVKESLGIPLSKFRRADHLRLMRAPKAEKFLPGHLMLPAFRYFLEGIGLDLKTASGSTILIDDAMHPKKNPRAACYTITVPSDIRITVKPSGGVMSWSTMFHEGGHALHYAWTTEKRFAFQHLGNYTATEAYAELFARAWADPVWLKRYREMVKARNRRPEKPAEILARLRAEPAFAIASAMGMVLPPARLRTKPTPLMKDTDIAYLIRHRLAWEMYLYRRYGWAKLIYESVLHGGGSSVFSHVYKGQVTNRRKLYKELLSKAYGYGLTDADAELYLFDVDDLFYAADYARAFVVADSLHDHLRTKFGLSWYTNKQVGPYLKALWAKGNRWTGEELLEHIGYRELSYDVSESRVRRLLKEADALAGGRKGASATRPKPRCAGGVKPTRKGFCPIPKKRKTR